jgi:hypothetical protein
MSKNQILSKMLDRLFAGLTSGPNLNCRPHSSRQRIDWMQFAKLQDISPADALRQLLSDKQPTQLQARVNAPKNAGKPSSKRRPAAANEELEKTSDSEPLAEFSPEDQHKKVNWSAQQAVLTKLRGLAEDAREYEQDTGVHVLHVGFPLLSLPPGAGGSVTGGTKRLLAPIAFIPISLELRAGLNPAIAIAGLHDGADFLVPNEALFAWLERQTGQPVLPEQVMPTRNAEEGEQLGAESQNTTAAMSTLDSWEELNDLTGRVAKALGLPQPTITAASLDQICAAPRTEANDSRPEIVMAAVIGLFPMNNQGLLRDMQAMSAAPEGLQGPVQSFISTEALLQVPLEPNDAGTIAGVEAAASKYHRNVAGERLVTMADPCQSRAVRLARESQGLVIHGPPGTGKSQTITNIIGDHLARGERVLLVCDKRTALDVVARRLEHLGLGSLCALIHDPQHDQRNLYMQIREQLEQLTSTKTDDRAASQLRSLDRQLQKSYDTLLEAWSLVMSNDLQRHTSFHQRMGEWLECALPSLTKLESASIKESSKPTQSPRRSRTKTTNDALDKDPVTVELLDEHLTEVRDIVTRAIQVGLNQHPWRECAGMPLATFLEQPASRLRQHLSELVAIAAELDRTRDEAIPPFIVPQQKNTSGHEEALSTRFPQQLMARKNLVASLRHCLGEVDPMWRKRWAKASFAEIKRADDLLQSMRSARKAIESAALDPRLGLVLADKKTSHGDIAAQIGALQAYLTCCSVWYGWFSFGVRHRAQAILLSYGLPPDAASAKQLLAFLIGVTSRELLAAMVEQLTDKTRQRDTAGALVDDAVLLKQCERLELLFETLNQCHHSALATIKESAQTTLLGGSPKFLDALESSTSRGELLEELRLELADSGLFRPEWQSGTLERACCGESIGNELQRLSTSLDSLGESLRLQAILEGLPTSLRAIVEQALSTSSDSQATIKEVRHLVLKADIDQWLKSNPQLQGLDGTRLSNLFREVHRLEAEKQPLVRELVLDYWIHRQQKRLLASTGTRLNSAGADLRRRLTTRGERAMRLRQVVAVGSKIEGGDPLFDLRPVWMASPETVAQIFPREAMFDVVIFDEASQCRLEEALPVLTRAKRVVIAGDPKQLPPTRFFESAVVTSDNIEVETEQDLFEAHQSEVEDLLTAALSLDIQESHLDVHYRSRNADLVEFSNQQFYGSRLQAIPGHPRNRIRFAPISLYHVGGVYEERANAAEAAQVVKIVADLLRRSEPPSIGIACFNLTQRDQILEVLAAFAAEDPDFAERLGAARNRVGTGAFEGLFVKNLENVQGDERDHMIISTTYGPDKQGRFYRRFGPLGQVGGGRRLNVLVTRARDEVHLVTSIPAELYRNLPPIPEGQHPGGGWLLFAYLAYAERLSDVYRQWRSDDPGQINPQASQVNERSSKASSQFASQLAQLVALRHSIGSDTHWGNDGFCVDVAFHHPRFPEDRTLGLLCDGTRFANTDDPVTWDVFRTAVLEGQGWQLVRCWTPQFFRDPEGHLRQYVTEATRIADSDPDPEAIPVVPAP